MRSMSIAGLIDHPIPKFLRGLDPSPLDFPYLYRTSHSRSAGCTTEHEVTCGSWPLVDFLQQWVHDEPAQHFDNHFKKYSTSPTMFISTTPEFLRALQIAVQLFREEKQDVKITIISVAAAVQTNHDITNAGVIARRLNRSDSTLKATEWLFLGRIKNDAVVHQINFDHRLYSSLCGYFPSFGACMNLEGLRNGVRGDFGIYDQWVFDGSNPAVDDGRRCAFVANNFGLDLRNLTHLYACLVKEMWSWKGPFTPYMDQVRQFEETVNFGTI